MFKGLYSALVLGIGLFLVIPLSGQRLVSTSPETKRVVLEEFGGMYCVYCPHGHQIIQNLQEALGDDFIALNYHAGIYAAPINGDPDLRTDYGETIVNRTGLSGFPAGTVNRQVFPGLEQETPGTTALNRTHWATAVQQELAENAPVNIALEASLNVTTRELEVFVEYYYTADAPGAENRLHLAVLENEVLAPQHGGIGTSYYAHHHVVRDFLTGMNGHRITGNRSGTFGSLSFRDTLPTHYRDIWADPVNIELVAFITEGEQNILNGRRIAPTLDAAESADANFLALVGPDDVCETDYEAYVLLRNDGRTPLTSLTVNYGLAGGSFNQYDWNGELGMFETTTVVLPEIPLHNPARDNEVYVALAAPNTAPDPTPHNNERNHAFTVAPYASTDHLELALRTDEYGFELYWEVVDDFGQVYASGGNQVVGATSGGAQIATPDDDGAYPSHSLIIEDIYLPREGCYQLRVIDDFGDGLCCNYGNGFYRLRKPGHQPLLQGASFATLESQFFSIGFSVVNTSELQVSDEKFVLSPNPLSRGQQLQISHSDLEAQSYQWMLYNATGQLLEQGSALNLPNTSTLTPGYYLLELLLANHGRQSLPFIIQ